MGKRLIIAEKPSVGREIAHVLHCTENKRFYYVGDNDIVTWAIGHLVGLCMPEDMDPKLKNWNLEDLPIFPESFQLKVIPNTARQYGTVKKLMLDPEVDSIVCATDAGREGELIFRYIYHLAGCTKPVERLWISSLTYKAIEEGFKNLKPASEYDQLYESAKCRSEADWLVGINGTRAYAVTAGVKTLSVGRVMSPTLSILVQRELEIRNFVPEKYLEVRGVFPGYTGKLLNPDGTTRFPMEQKQELEQFISTHSGTGTVTMAEYTEEAYPAQMLYDLTSLQRDANRLFRMSSKKTLDTAQQLYEKKLITYPRTDSRFLSSDMASTLKKRLESLCETHLKVFAEKALTSEKNLFGHFINDKGVSDHHAIIPTGEVKGMSEFTKEEQRIYDLIARRFIGMYYPDRVVRHQKIETTVDGMVFRSSGEKLLDKGWNAVDISRKYDEKSIKEVKAGAAVAVNSMQLLIGETTPPAPHTEASLLAAMEHAGKIIDEDSTDDRETEFGIGTPATRANEIEKLVSRGMVFRKARTLIPSEFGIKLVSILPEDLQSPELTGQWEARLNRIRNGKESPEQFMTDIREIAEKVVEYAIEQVNQDIKAALFVGSCPVCGSPVREYSNSYYCVNKACSFRRIYKKPWKKEYPNLDSAVMRNLLENHTAKTDRGTFTLHKEKPFITFENNDTSEPDTGENSTKPAKELGLLEVKEDKRSIHSEPSINAEVMGDASIGEKYSVLDIVTDDEYTWYCISKDPGMWIADRNGEWINYTPYGQ